MRFSVRRGVVGAALAMIMGLPAGLTAQQGDGGMEETTRRRADEGGGPYERLVLQNVTVIDGTGAPPQSGVTIVIEGDRIAGVLRVYLRNPADLPDIKRTLGRIIPHDMPRVYLNGDICRTDLLTEVDGIISCQ